MLRWDPRRVIHPLRVIRLPQSLHSGSSLPEDSPPSLYPLPPLAPGLPLRLAVLKGKGKGKGKAGRGEVREEEQGHQYNPMRNRVGNGMRFWLGY